MSYESQQDLASVHSTEGYHSKAGNVLCNTDNTRWKVAALPSDCHVSELLSGCRLELADREAAAGAGNGRYPNVQVRTSHQHGNK